MTKKDWEKIIAARDRLGLGEAATLADIKKAYRRLSKIHHPDLAGGDKESRVRMQQVTEAYQTLLLYCKNYRFPLVMQTESLDAEDWWFDRFGQDPLWGKSNTDSD
ncbi:MAG: DnaJ domain-containing protein [Pseudomonadota bacterium]